MALTLLASALLATSAAAESALGLRMSANATTVRVGDTFQLDVVLNVNGQDAVDELELPDMTDFNVLRESEAQSASVNLIGGRRAVVVEHRRSFVLQATEVGTKQIGEARARMGGNTARAAPITIRVVAGRDGSGDKRPRANAGANGANAANDGDGTAEDADNNDEVVGPTDADEPGGRFEELPRVFVELRADKARAVVGEQITVRGEVYSQVPLGQYPRVPGLKPAGFVCLTIDDGTRLQATQRVLRGRSYYVYPVTRDALFATAPGDVEIAPLELEVTPAGSFFSRSQDLHVKSAPLPLRIESTPTPAPADFQVENVGRMELRASVRPTAVKAGEPFTLVVEVVGWGNTDAFVLPAYAGGDDVRVFPKTTKRERRDRDGLIAGRVVEETLIQPTRPGRMSIAPLTLHFFDPTEGRYVTRHTPPLAVVVGGSAATVDTPQKRQTIASGARPLKLGIDARGGGSSGVAGVAGVVVFVIGALGGAVGGQRRRRHESRQGQHQRRRQQRHAVVKAAFDAADLQSLQRALMDALADVAGDDVRGMDTTALPQALSARGVSAAVAAAVASAIVAAEAARFSPAGAKREAVDAVAKAIAAVEADADANDNGRTAGAA